MPAEAQSTSSQAVAVQFGAVSEEADRMVKVEAFLRSCKALSEEAERNGLTEEILAEILAEE